ncbi:hypothetical protein GSI_03623 [Ganoderma sinense ZZ0214-1]|uniref:Uncharacterized protein n=1 Tax=Ganoderma sinense ZZ0214-1 TaxID=1077348 RepID=A0A2G8SJG2_9APHY|nr:hypothetical protein GSI_03623 [Ganoderma sinense ZZ0214-1]
MDIRHPPLEGLAPSAYTLADKHLIPLSPKVFAPLLRRFEHLSQRYPLGILIASCIGMRPRMGFLNRKAIPGVSDRRPRLCIRAVAPTLVGRGGGLAGRWVPTNPPHHRLDSGL